MRASTLILFFSLILNGVMAQVSELGFHVGYNATRLGVDQESLSDELTIDPGRYGGGPVLGLQLLISPPKKQSSPKMQIIPSAMFESSLCRCENTVGLLVKNPNGTNSLINLNYLLYRADFSGKFVASIRDVQLMVGPTLSANLYAGAKVGGGSSLKYVGDHFQRFVLGYEIGFGKKINALNFSVRYHGLLERYGQSSELIPTAYKNHQLLFRVGYFFLQKETGSYWSSIYRKR